MPTLGEQIGAADSTAAPRRTLAEQIGAESDTSATTLRTQLEQPQDAGPPMLTAHRRGPTGEVGLLRRIRAMLEPSPVERPSAYQFGLNVARDIPGAQLAAAETVSEPIRRPREFVGGAIERARRIIEPAARATAADIAGGSGTMIAGPARQGLASEFIREQAAKLPHEAVKFAYEHPAQTLLTVAAPLKAGAEGIAGGAARAIGAEAEVLPTAGRIARAVSREAPAVKIPRQANLPPEQAAVEQRFASSVEADPQAYIAAYRKRFGNVVDPDNARELSPDYAASVESKAALGTATHETASTLSKLVYQQMVAEPTPAGQSPLVLLTAGGTGSGKTTATAALRKGAQVVFDGSLSNYKSAKTLIDQALAGNKLVQLVYVYRDPLESYMNGVLKRAPRIGRLTPLEFHARTHADAPRNILRIANEYADNPNVVVRVIDNSGPAPTEVPVAFLETKQHLSEGGIHATIRQVLEQEQAAGRLPAGQYERALAPSPRGQAPAAVGTGRGIGLAGGAGAGAARGVAADVGPPAVRTRVNQVHPDNAPVLKAIEESPDFQERLADLGGGRVITHEQTLAEALKQPPMTVDELAATTSRAPVEIARAGILRSRVWNAYQAAGERGDFAAQQAAHAVLERLEPGYQNLTGNSARATEYQKVLQFNNDLWQKARDLRAAGVDQAEAARQLNAEVARATKALQLEKLGKGWEAAINRVLNYTVAAKLTSPVTHAVNTISNTLTYAQRSAEQLVGSGYALVGQMDPALARAMARNAFPTLQGFRDGVRGFMDEFGEHPRGQTKFDVPLPEGPQRVYPLPMRLLNPFRWLGAADAMWKGIITNQHLTSLAYETALRENSLRVRNGAQPLAGQAFAARVKSLMDNAPATWREQAAAQAAEYTFQDDPGATINAISRAVRQIPLLGRLVVPFVRTPANVARFYARRSPIGALASRSIREGLVAGGRARAEAVGKLAVGTALQIEAFNAAQRGDITGAPSSDPNQAALDRARGIRPYTIRVGPVRLNYGRFSPQGLYLISIAEIHRALKEGRTADAQKMWENTLFRMVRGLKEQTFLSGISDAFDALGSPERFFDRFVQGTVTGAVFPSVFRDVNAQLDPFVHQPRNMREAVQAMLPFMSTGLQPKLDIFGRPILQPRSRLARGTKVISESRVNEATEILRNAGYSPTEPRPIVKGGGHAIDLSEGGYTPEATLFLFDIGHATEAAVLREGRKRAFQAAPPEAQARGLKRAVTEARNAVRDRWAARYHAALKAAPRSTPGGLEE